MNSTYENKVALYRSAFNSEFRNNIRYDKEDRYGRNVSVTKHSKSKDDKNISARSKEISSSEDFKKELQDTSPTKSILKESAYVGFANLPNQVYWKAAKKGFEFTLMVVGASGLGKSTLVNSLFLSDIYNPNTYPGPSSRRKKTVSVETTRVKLRESGVNLILTLVDTPGFGDAVNNSKSWIPIVDYIESKYEDYFAAETKVDRKLVPDQRVHCCLYFIHPTGHNLKLLDIQCMKYLSDKVNIIPVIAKADTLTPEECSVFKKQILNDIEDNNINIYRFPDIHEEDEEYELNKSLKELVPFAVVGSNTVVEIDGRYVRGRKYSWGVVDIENLEHCDFTALRKVLISTHMQDLRETTHNIHYENFRCRKLSGISGGGIINNPFLELEEERRGHELKLELMEMEMKELLKRKLREKEKELKDIEKLLKMRYEVTKRTLEEETREFEERRRIFELEKKAWESERFICFNKF